MQGYLSTARMCIWRQGYFGIAELFGKYVMRFVKMFALFMIWRALFAQGADTEGMTLNQMLVYTLLSAALAPLLDIRTPMDSMLHDGSALSLYMRPMDLLGQLVAQTVGEWGIPMLFFGIPAMLLAPLFGVSLRPSGWAWLPSLILTVSQGFAVDFLFLCLTIRMKNMFWTVMTIRSALTVLLTGALIPFAVLPWGLGNILALSPFGTLAGAPLSLFVGLGDARTLLTAQVCWNLLLWPMAIAWFGKSTERLVSYGG